MWKLVKGNLIQNGVGKLVEKPLRSTAPCQLQTPRKIVNDRPQQKRRTLQVRTILLLRQEEGRFPSLPSNSACERASPLRIVTFLQWTVIQNNPSKLPSFAPLTSSPLLVGFACNCCNSMLVANCNSVLFFTPPPPKQTNKQKTLLVN